MIDIADVSTDLVMIDTQVPRAVNILNVQLGSLEYAPDIGIDLNYFLRDGISFQNESFQKYTIEALANQGINVASLLVNNKTLFSEYFYNLAPQETSTALVAR